MRCERPSSVPIHQAYVTNPETFVPGVVSEAQALQGGGFLNLLTLLVVVGSHFISALFLLMPTTW